VKQAGIGMAVALLGYGLYTASSGSKGSPQSPPMPPSSTWAQACAATASRPSHGDLKKIIDGQQQLGDRVTAIEEGKVQPGSKVASTTPDMGELPPALPGVEIPTSPPSGGKTGRGKSAGDIDSLPAPPSVPIGPVTPPAPPAPPVEKTVGAIGGATSSILPSSGKDGGKDGAGSGAKKTGRSFCRLVL
jgi:conjugal transfer pilus assembly protein TraB